MYNCDRCNKPAPGVFDGEGVEKDFNTQVDFGLHLYATGYYGGFWDTMAFMGEEGVSFTLCHDCSAWLCREIPKMATEAKGGHGFSSNTEDRCCEFAGDWDTPRHLRN